MAGVQKRPFSEHPVVRIPYFINPEELHDHPSRIYGYARVSKADDDSKNLETQLRILADHGIRDHLVFTDVASGRSLQRPGWQALWKYCSLETR